MSIREERLFSESKIYIQVDPDALINNAGLLLSRRHCHYEYEVKLCLSGSFYVDIDGQRLLLRANQAIMTSPMQYHSIHEDPGGRPQHFTFRFLLDEEMSERIGRRFPVPYILFPVTPQMEALCSSVLQSHLLKRELYWEDELFAVLKALICCILRELKIEDARRQDKPVNDEVFMRALQIRRYFTKCIDEQREPKLQDIAVMLNLSVNQTSRVIQSIYGTSFRRAILDIRMDRATYLLRETDMPVIEIIHQIGYKEESEFYHKFYERYHLTPGSYRKQGKMGNSQPDG